MISRHRNIYIGITGLPAKRLLELFPQIPSYPDPFIFGSDWPGVPNIRSFAERIQRLPLDPEIIERILWKTNATEILGL